MSVYLGEGSGSACSLGIGRYWNMISSCTELAGFPKQCPLEAATSMGRAGRFLALPGLWHSVLGGGQKEGEQMIG